MNLSYIKKALSDEKFDPYENTSGTCITIKQKDFILIGSDTRHSSEMGINSRTMSKVFIFHNNMVMTATGFYADCYEVFVKMKYNIKIYQSHNNREISIHSAAHLLHNILYSKRFFPYYSVITLCGFYNNEAVVYSYDPVGSYDTVDCRCSGSSESLIQPILDSIMSNNQKMPIEKNFLSEEESIDITRKAFDSAVERDVKTGDYLEIFLMKNKCSLDQKRFGLRKD